jgi:RimJ/RimL family protein N-acetyltransferase
MMSEMRIEPITLAGKFVRLEPLSLTHVPDLTLAGQDESIWRYMLYGNIQTEEQMRAWVINLLERQQRGTDLPFAVIDLGSARAIGATRYLEIRTEHHGLEIGGTWYAVPYQHTRINTECKYLLLRHAFEDLGCVRVQFKTDLRNERSQHAIERLGAVKEGVLRKHLITPEGYLRDSVYYSIIYPEWPGVKKKLEGFLNA